MMVSLLLYSHCVVVPSSRRIEKATYEEVSCRVLGQPRAMQQRQPTVPDQEELLRSPLLQLARQYGRYEYRRITALLWVEGWLVNHKRIERL